LISRDYTDAAHRAGGLSSALGQSLAIAAILGLVALLTISRLSSPGICGSNEAVEAVFVQQMVERGDFLFPLDNGREPMYKPPLFHWSSAAIDRALGIDRVTPFNLRIASALYAIAGAGLTMGFAIARLGPEGAIMSGLVLAASYEYISQGRIGRVDMTLTFFETLSLIGLLAWLEAAPDSTVRAALHYILALSLGLGVLAKGPVGALIPGLAICLYLALERRWKDFSALLRPWPVLVGVSIASSWYFACLIGRQFGFLNRQIGIENLGRFFGTLGRMSSWYYVQPLLLSAGPLSLLIPMAVGAAIITYFDGRAAAPEIDPAVECAGRAARLFAIFWVTTVAFFELAAYKRKAYLLPLWPASAILLAWWVYKRGPGLFGRLVPRAVIATCAVLIIANFFYIPWREVRDCGARLSLVEALEWPFVGSRASERISSQQVDSYEGVAEAINRVVDKKDGLFVYGFGEALEPLLFCLRRNVVPLAGPLEKAPPGYVLVPCTVWAKFSGDRSEFCETLVAPHGIHGRDSLVLLHHGKPCKTVTLTV
jgi:4-amino-4-deoxy-L-arabinose transferase-like glycosyltransferase